MSNPTIVRLNHELFGGSISLRRTPLYLRFTVVGLHGPWPVWDALDQPGDQPNEGEIMIAGRLGLKGQVHVDRTVNGRHVGEWWASAIYDVCESQPSQELMGDWEQWQAWCHEQSRMMELGESCD